MDIDSFTIRAYKRERRCSEWSRTTFPFDKIGKSRRIDIQMSRSKHDGVIRIRSFSKSPNVSPNIISFESEKVSLRDTLEFCFIANNASGSSVSFYFHAMAKYQTYGYSIEIEYDRSETITLLYCDEFTVANHHWESSGLNKNLNLNDFVLFSTPPQFPDFDSQFFDQKFEFPQIQCTS